MASRDRIRQNEAYASVVSQLGDELRSHPGLKALNAARRKREIEKAIESESGSVDAFRNCCALTPASQGCFLQDFNSLLLQARDPPPFKGKTFPTVFRLAKEPKNGLTKTCPIDGSIRVEFVTDAENAYFKRTDSPGTIRFDVVGVQERWHLWNGRLLATLRPTAESVVGDQVIVRVTVSDVEDLKRGGPFKTAFNVHVGKSLERVRKTHEQEETKKHKAPGDKEKFSMLAAPNIVEVSKDKWEDMEPPFSSLDALRVRQDGDGGYDFYLNIDNSFLLTEMSRNGVTEKRTHQVLVQIWAGSLWAWDDPERSGRV